MSISKPPEQETVFFLDRTHGRHVMADLLRRVGMKVEVHADHFPQEENDDVWITACARRGWAIITGDRAIEKMPFNRQAVIDSQAKVFPLTDSNSRVEEWAAAIIVGRRRMEDLVRKHKGPFFVTIGKASQEHVSPVRFIDQQGNTIRPMLQRKKPRTKPGSSG